MRILRPLLVAGLALSLGGCSSIEDTIDYCAKQTLICAAAGAAVVAGAVLAASSHGHAAGTMTASDLRLKRDVRYVGTLENGVHLYAFRYLGDDRVFVGPVAQDLLRDSRFKSAVHETTGGYYVVDYAALGLAIDGNADAFAAAGQGALGAAR